MPSSLDSKSRRTRRDSPPPPAARKAAGGDKRAQIVEAALSLFVERGFHGTAVPEIAERAGVGAGTIYRYFDSKEALVNVIYRELKQQFATATLDGIPPGASTREQFRLLWMRMAKFATERPSAFIFLELHHHAPYLDADSRALEQRTTALFGHVVTTAQARGELKRGDPQVLMGMVMGGFIGVIRSCRDIERPPGEADWKLAEQCMWEAVRA